MDVKDMLKDLYRRNPKFAISRGVGDILKKARESANLTQHELAKKLHTAQESIARAESGRITPSLHFISRVAEATGNKFKMPKIVINKHPNQEK